MGHSEVTVANHISSTVVTRRPRVLLLFSKRAIEIDSARSREWVLLGVWVFFRFKVNFIYSFSFVTPFRSGEESK
jgi:hypothetical protein